MNHQVHQETIRIQYIECKKYEQSVPQMISSCWK